MTDDLPFEVRKARRSGARLAVVQALYQLEQTGQSGASVVRDFMDDRLGLDPEGTPIDDADPDIFKRVLLGVVDRQSEIDKAIERRLAEGWRLSRIDALSRAVLRGGVFELMDDISLSTAVIVDEYVSVAHAFFDDQQPAFINGLLDTVAKDVRAEL